MQLKEMKKITLGLIEELNKDSQFLTDDPDIATKINSVINTIQFELARIKKIPAKYVHAIVTEGDRTLSLSSIDALFQLNKVIGCSFEVVGDLEIVFDQTYLGDVSIYYYKMPERITDTTEDTYIFELTDEILEIMPFGVAADLLKADPSVDYTIYATRYEQLKQGFDTRLTPGMIYIDSSEVI